MSKHAVIDTNVLVALVDSRDKWHASTLELRTALKAQDVRLLYFDCVMNEAVSVLGRRAEEQKRAQEFPVLLERLTRLVPDTEITWLSHDTHRLFADVMSLVRQTNGALNFHDALIALGCRDLGVSLIVSFDSDFDRIGWITRLASPDDVRRASAADVNT